MKDIFEKISKTILANITNGLEKVFYHAVVIYALDNDIYKIKDSYGKSYEIPKNRCTFMQVRSQLGVHVVQFQIQNMLQGFFYRLCDAQYRYELPNIRTIFSEIDFDMAAKSNLTEAKDWLLYDSGFTLKMKIKDP